MDRRVVFAVGLMSIGYKERMFFVAFDVHEFRLIAFCSLVFLVELE